MARFFQYTLRTTDAARARAFYAAVLGRDDAEIFPLHEQALARGARPHWLGFIEVGDVDAAASTFGARGATVLGPKWVNPQGLEAVVVRDPGGALVALAKPPSEPPAGGAVVTRPDVVWHELNTADVERAKVNYGELLGCHFGEPLELDNLGTFHPFSWVRGEAAIGSMSDVANRAGVHPHWVFHFRVAALGPALDALRAGGGVNLPPLVLPSGDRIAICDDPQGAAFALFEERR